MRMFKIIFWEFLLLFASVLVFRSFWTLLDRMPEMNNEFGISASLFLGAIVALTTIFMINKYAERTEKQTKGENEPSALALALSFRFASRISHLSRKHYRGFARGNSSSLIKSKCTQ